MSSRELVTVEQLLEILNDRLSRSDACDDCRFDGPVYRLRGTDDLGCNWDRGLTLRCSGVSPAPCAGHADQVIFEVSERYNLAPIADG